MSGMQKFVRDKNGQSEDARALYADVPPNPGANVKRSISQRDMKAPGSPAGIGAPLAHVQPGDGRKFYETDASSVGDTSTIGSLPRANGAAQRPGQPQPPTNGYSRGDRGESPLREDEEYTDVSEEDDDDQHLPDNPLRDSGQLNPKQAKLLKAIESGKGRKPDESDLIEQLKPQMLPPSSRAPPAVHDGPPNRGPGTRSVLAPHAQNQGQPRRQSPEKRSAPEIQRPDGLFQAPAAFQRQVADDAAVGFSFSKATQSKLATRPAAAASRPLPAPLVPQPRLTQQLTSSLTAQQGSQAPIAKHGLREGGRDRQSAPAFLPDETALRQHHEQVTKSASKHKSRTGTPVQPPVIEEPQQYERPSDSELHSEDALHNGFQRQEGQRAETPLDYPIPQLLDMDYKDLKAANFDSDPDLEPVSLPCKNLDENLETLSRAGHKDQEHFFASLNISQWEEAGDWFLDRFANIVSRLKDARQEKRKAARSFEDEVEKRHQAVSKKRKLTEDALSEMKASGAQVLQGTPKKAKKTK